MPNQFTHYHTQSGWSALLSSSPIKANTVTHSFEADYIVIGAGFAGVSAARELALAVPMADIVLLEAGELLQNSSTRNSGFMIDLPYTKIDQRSEVAVQKWQIDLMSHGKACLWSQVKEDPERASYWTEAGHYKGASTHIGSQTLQKIEQILKEKQVDYKKLNSVQAERLLGTNYYKGMLWVPHCTLVQPAALLRRLLTTLPKNVHVFSDSKVTATTSSTKGVRLKIGKCYIQAKKVVWAINSQLAELGLERTKQLSVYTYACLTEPINAFQQSLGNATFWGLTPAEQLEATMRKLPDGRLLFRAGFSYKKELPIIEQTNFLYEGIIKRYPSIRQDQLQFVWGGAVSLTRNGAPIFKRKNKNEIIISGCNASGILKMTALGHLAATDILDKKNKILVSTKKYSKPNYIPPEPIRKLAINFKINKLKKELRA